MKMGLHMEIDAMMRCGARNEKTMGAWNLKVQGKTLPVLREAADTRPVIGRQYGIKDY